MRLVFTIKSHLFKSYCTPYLTLSPSPDSERIHAKACAFLVFRTFKRLAHSRASWSLCGADESAHNHHVGAVRRLMKIMMPNYLLVAHFLVLFAQKKAHRQHTRVHRGSLWLSECESPNGPGVRHREPAEGRQARAAHRSRNLQCP